MKVTGYVEATSNKFDKYSILVNDTWYSSKFEIKAERGDQVEFDDGGKKFCQKLRVIAPGGGGMTGGSVDNKVNTSRDRSIVRQNALSHATTVVIDGGYKDTTVDATVDTIIEVARKFEAYSSGDEDVKAVDEHGDFID